MTARTAKLMALPSCSAGCVSLYIRTVCRAVAEPFGHVGICYATCVCVCVYEEERKILGCGMEVLCQLDVSCLPELNCSQSRLAAVICRCPVSLQMRSVCTEFPIPVT